MVLPVKLVDGRKYMQNQLETQYTRRGWRQTPSICTPVASSALKRLGMPSEISQLKKTLSKQI